MANPKLLLQLRLNELVTLPEDALQYGMGQNLGNLGPQNSGLKVVVLFDFPPRSSMEKGLRIRSHHLSHTAFNTSNKKK
jgi:hypothetical protein